MKKIWFFLAAAAVFMMFTTAFASETKEQSASAEIRDSSMPAGLRIIETEAFEGTSLTGILLPESLEQIDERAFADMDLLRRVYIPETAEILGDDLFGGNESVLITGPANSTGIRWARKHDRLFRALNMIRAQKDKKETAATEQVDRAEKRKTERNGECCIAEKRVQRPGRLTGELKASHYKGIAAQHIQSRFFP